MALDLERARGAFAEVDDACVLARALEHRGPLRREVASAAGRVLVAAMLGPEEREDAELEVVRVAPEQASDTVELPVGEAERAVERLFRHGAQERLHSIAPAGARRASRCVQIASRGGPRLRTLAGDRRRDLGRVVPLHQGRGRRGRADGDDVLPPRACERRSRFRCSPGAWVRAARSAEVRATGWRAFAVGFLNAAFPFVLIAWGEKYVDSGVAAIANATVPIFVVLLALRFNPSERVRGVRLAGILVGFAGVGVLAGLHPEGGWWAAAGTLAIVVASLSYASANHFVQHNYSTTAPLVIATVSCGTAAVILLPFALVQWPDGGAELGGDRLDCGARCLRDGRGAPLLLPLAQPLRGGAGLARDVPPSSRRPRLRRPDPRRAGRAERGCSASCSSWRESRSGPVRTVCCAVAGGREGPSPKPSRPTRPREAKPQG